VSTVAPQRHDAIFGCLCYIIDTDGILNCGVVQNDADVHEGSKDTNDRVFNILFQFAVYVTIFFYKLFHSVWIIVSIEVFWQETVDGHPIPLRVRRIPNHYGCMVHAQIIHSRSPQTLMRSAITTFIHLQPKTAGVVETISASATIHTQKIACPEKLIVLSAEVWLLAFWESPSSKRFAHIFKVDELMAFSGRGWQHFPADDCV
jgi:hypothetical protein